MLTLLIFKRLQFQKYYIKRNKNLQIKDLKTLSVNKLIFKQIVKIY